MSKLLSTMQNFNNPDTFGNQILYDMCVNNADHPWGKADILADKIWLIGRSYAASPERRYRFNNGYKSKDFEKEIARGDGTGQYFYKTAEYILEDKENYSELVSLLEKMRPYSFDGGDEDIKQLKNAIHCVALFNGMIKSASKKYDDEFNETLSGKVKYKNQISFCSKFLHFHAPHTIFIIDRFSREGGRLLCSTRTRKNAELKDSNVVIDKAVREAISAFYSGVRNSVHDIDAVADEKSKTAVEEYISHCLYSYGFGCFLCDESELSPENALCSFLRLIDAIFQRVKI